MVALISDLSAVSRPLFQRSRGLIGIDLGTRFIKVAQVRPALGTWKLAAVHSVAVNSQKGLCEASLNHGVIHSSLNGVPFRRSGFSGCRAVVGLPDKLAECRSFEFPVSSDSELTVMLQQELNSNDVTQSDHWTCEVVPSSEGDLCRVNAVEVSQKLLNRCAEDLMRVGLDCQVIDAIPFKLARAVQFVDHDLHNGPVAALDWGAGQPTLVIVNEEGPIFSRSLRDCGLRSALEQIQLQLNLSELECAQLLATCGVTSAGKATAHLAERVGRCMTECLDNLLHHLQQTLKFVEQRGIQPQHMWMFGCGGAIAGMDHVLSSQLGLDTRCWALSSDQLSRSIKSLPNHAVFGAAVGYSLLNTDD